MTKLQTEVFNPYQVFQNWLFNKDRYTPFPEDCLKGINKRAVLSSLGKLGGVTIFLNETFNNFNLMSLPDIEFYTFVKIDIIQRFRVDRWGLSFFKTEKKNKSIKDLHSKLPHLKPHEIYKLLDLAKDDDMFPAFEESLGLRKSKKSKLTKKDKKQIGEVMLSFGAEPSKPKQDSLDTLDEYKNLTFGHLLHLYGLQVNNDDEVVHQKPEGI